MFTLIPQDLVDVKHTQDGIIHGVMNGNPSFVVADHVKCTGGTAIYASSVYKFMDYVVNTYPEAAQQKSSIGYRPNFHDFPTWDEFIDVAWNRPHELKSFIAKDDILKQPESAGNEVEYGVTGDYLDIGRYLSGEPECFGMMILGNPRSLFATILINLSSTCHFKVDGLRARCQRLIRLVDWLEGQGIRTQIKAFHVNQCDYLEIDVKDADESINLTSLAIVTTPDFLRRLMFRVSEHSATFRSDYGTSCMVDNTYLKMPELKDQGLYIFSETRASGEQMERVFNEAEEKLTEQIFENDKFSNVVI